MPVVSAVPSASVGVPAPAPRAVLATQLKPGEPLPMPAAKTTSDCALDLIGEESAKESTVVHAGSEVKLVGWAADGAAGVVPPVVLFILDGGKKYHTAATRSTLRPDVAEALKSPVFLTAGYDILTRFEGVEPGAYSVRIEQVSAWGEVTMCDTHRKLELR